MTPGSVFRFFKLLYKDKLSFIYKGSFNNEITNKIIDLSNNLILDNEIRSNYINKVSFLMAECFQNIVRHEYKISSETVSEQPSGMFFSRQKQNSFIISSANLVHKSQIKELRNNLDKLNRLSTNELNALYLEVLGNSIISKKGGAGLGLIEMARKSKEKLDYYFESYDRWHSVFYLQIKVQHDEQVKQNIHRNQLKKTIDLHTKIIQEKILIVHKGDFSFEAVVPTLKMIENNIPEQIRSFNNRKKTYHMAVEILQNVTKHAPVIQGIKEGIFILAKDGEFYSINSGNFILNEKKQELENHLKKITSLNKYELDTLYKEVLKNGHFTNHGGAGLGLLDICRESSKKVKYKFFNIDDQYSFYAISTWL